MKRFLTISIKENLNIFHILSLMYFCQTYLTANHRPIGFEVEARALQKLKHFLHC